MKDDPRKNLISKLNQIKKEVEFLASTESKSVFQKNIDDLIADLTRLRDGLMDPSLEEKATEIYHPLEQVISFLESSKSDDVFKILLLSDQEPVVAKPKRQPVEISDNLTNEQIRALLEKELSKTELKAIAAQRAISVGKSTNDEIKQDILKNLQRQEDYERLGAS